MELKQGTLLQNGKYRIEKVLGQGSFGITYLATMKTKVGGNLGNMEATVKVAIKEFFMSDMDGRDGSMVTYSRGNVLHENYKEKFRKESEKLSKLSHRNIVKVLDSFAANNTYYYVMEYCAGGSLDEMIYRRGGLGEAEALAYTKDICSALSYMHSHKMLHLDLKPGNIMLRSSGEAVLIDFGLSKEYDKSGKPETSTTIGLGTKGYAPLEQSNYNKGDSKVFPVTMDVYAMGGTIYKMLTSQTPPEASEILNSGFPVGELKSRGISNDLIEALEQAMSPMVKGRPQSMKEFLSILDGEAEGTVIDDDQGQKPTPKPNRMEREQYANTHGSISGHAYVDLGLPSGIKWATCNVGADSPEDYGDYFAWGEVNKKASYTGKNSKTYGKSSYNRDIGGDKSIDAASANWGGSWRLPTKAECEELKNKCTWKWTTQKGVSGYKVKGPNGNSIFLPAAGYRNGSSLYNAGENGNYWSSTPYESYSDGAYRLGFNSGSHGVGWGYRGYGRSVRPVSE